MKILFAIMLFFVIGCDSNSSVTFKRNVHWSEVRFVDLSKVLTSDICYYENSYFRAVSFKISEEEFLSLFSSYSFEEISEEEYYYTTRCRIFWDSGAKTGATDIAYSGLKSEGTDIAERGVHIVFDRDSGAASYSEWLR